MAPRRASGDGIGRRGAVGFADLLQVLARLDLRTREQAVAAARCVGFGGVEMNPAEAPRGAAGQQHRQRRRPPPPRPAVRAAAVPPPRPPSRPPLPERIVDSALDTLDPLPDEPAPPWFEAARRDAAGAVDAPAPPPPPPAARWPLLPERTASAVLRSTVATRRPGADPDIARILDGLLAGAVPDPLPMRPEAALHRGVQLLLDLSPSMAPWYPDLRELATSLTRFVGRSLCEVYRFDDDPAHATPAARGARRHAGWRARRGRPVLLASALDLAPRDPLSAAPDPGRWGRFVAATARAGIPVVCLIPVGPERWPAELARTLPLVHWDPATRAETVRRMVGAGHEVDD